MLKHKHHVYGQSCDVPFHMNFGQKMLDNMMEYKDITALINADTEESLTYGELAQNTVDVALSLARIGVRKGDVISICSEKRFEVMATILGAVCAGATFSPTDITYGTAPLLHRVNISKPKIMFCSEAAFKTHKQSFDTVGSIDKYIVYYREDLSQSSVEELGGIWYKDFLVETADVKDFMALPVDGWKDFLFILFSSGTTGLPKGVAWTHLGLLVNSIEYTNESFKGNGYLNTREWYYTYGLLVTLGALREGATVVYSYRNTHKDCLAAIHRYKIKNLQLAPSSVTELIKSPILEHYDLSSVTGICSSSTPLMADQIQAVKKRLPNLLNVYQIYGTTEAGAVCNELHAPLGPRPGSAGTASSGFVLKVVDLNTRQAVGPGERGEICFKSPSLTPGYLGVSDRDYMDEDGFYKTGDVGYYDQDDYFYIVNRTKELIKYNDISIAPAELESILLQHPAVKEVGVVGSPHPDCGEAPTAFVVKSGYADQGELVEYLETRITFRMKMAGGVRFVDKLPRGPGDKLDRNALKAMLTSTLQHY